MYAALFGTGRLLYGRMPQFYAWLVLFVVSGVGTWRVLRGVTIPKTGQAGTSGVGLMVTKTMVVMGDPQVTTTPEHPRGAMLRAYDKMTGRQYGAIWMPAIQSGSPMTYWLDGRQYIVVAVSGGNYSGEYLAFALPAR